MVSYNFGREDALDILITDLTVMHGGVFCLAGWNFATNRMVRPLPGGNNWNAEVLQRLKISTGSIIRVVPEGNHTSTLPHATEDMRILENEISVHSHDYSDWLELDNAPILYGSINDAFDNNIDLGRKWNSAYKVSVAEGVNCKSLAGVRLPSSSVSFFKDQYRDNPPTLRAYITDKNHKYNLPVSCRRLRALFNSGDINQVQGHLPANQDVHIRLGLARAFNGNPCSLMLNGIHW